MRAKNQKWVLCFCEGYHYPHRKGGGQCLATPSGQERFFAFLDTPMRGGRPV